MKIVTVICTARFWLALMLSVTLGMGATAADIHPVDAEEIACMTADAEAHHAAEIGDTENDDSDELMDMLLAKKRASERREWLENKGDLAEV